MICRELAIIDVCGPLLSRVEDLRVLWVRCRRVDPVIRGRLAPLFFRRACSGPEPSLSFGQVQNVCILSQWFDLIGVKFVST